MVAVGLANPQSWNRYAYMAGCPTLARAKRVKLLSHLNVQVKDVKVGHRAPFWQKRYYDRNIRNCPESTVKLRYLHRNPVKRGLLKNAADWKWSSFRHYAFHEGSVVEIESEWTALDGEAKALGLRPRVFLCPR